MRPNTYPIGWEGVEIKGAPGKEIKKIGRTRQENRRCYVPIIETDSSPPSEGLLLTQHLGDNFLAKRFGVMVIFHLRVCAVRAPTLKNRALFVIEVVST